MKATLNMLAEGCEGSVPCTSCGSSSYLLSIFLDRVLTSYGFTGLLCFQQWVIAGRGAWLPCYLLFFRL